MAAVFADNKRSETVRFGGPFSFGRCNDNTLHSFSSGLGVEGLFSASKLCSLRC